MSVFISYARDDRAAVGKLRQDLDRARAEVWLDDELSGGQAWWDVILEQIRRCELFVFALSPASLKSKACMSELAYAVSLRRPLLPVMVQPVSVQLAPREIADSHIVDYTERTAENAVALVTAVLGRGEPPPLPDPLPPAPPTPMSYMNPIREQITANELSYQQQAQLVIALRGHLQDDDARAIAVQLLGELRRRPDVAESVARDIDDLIRGASTGGASTAAESRPSPSSSTTPAGWFADPSGRFTHRYWDGSTWTEHVSSPSGQTTDPMTSAGPPSAGPTPTAPTPTAPSRVENASPRAAAAPFSPPVAASGQPAAAGPAVDTRGVVSGPPAFSGGVYAVLIVATVLVGIIGVIAGAVNMRHPARKGQAKVLLWLGLAMMVLSLLLLGSGG